jgi:hypothetical protein
LSETIVIDSRYCGAPGLANDGYAAGLLAARIGVSADASFRRPVPVGRELQIDRTGDGVSLFAAGELLVEAKRIDLQLPVPPPPSLAQAHEASARYLGRRAHLRFARCFGCGIERAAGFGLRIFAGPTGREDGAYAAPWVPESTFVDERGVVRPEFVWTALDCSGGIALMGDDAAPVLLPARLAARIDALPRAGEPYVVMAWVIQRGEGKHVTGTALFAAAGHLLALGRAQWLEPRVGFRA